MFIICKKCNHETYQKNLGCWNCGVESKDIEGIIAHIKKEYNNASGLWVFYCVITFLIITIGPVIVYNILYT